MDQSYIKKLKPVSSSCNGTGVIISDISNHPFYNEEENIEPLYEQLSNTLRTLNRQYKIIFIDDGSTDTTFKNMLKVREKDNNVKIIKFRKNFGQTAALKAGFDHSEGNIAISMDGDLQNDPTDIPKLIEKIEKEDYDVVCGWRADRKDSFSKKITSKFANLLRKITTDSKIHEARSGHTGIIA